MHVVELLVISCDLLSLRWLVGQEVYGWLWDACTVSERPDSRTGNQYTKHNELQRTVVLLCLGCWQTEITLRRSLQTEGGDPLNTWLSRSELLWYDSVVQRDVMASRRITLLSSMYFIVGSKSVHHTWITSRVNAFQKQHSCWRSTSLLQYLLQNYVY